MSFAKTKTLILILIPFLNACIFSKESKLIPQAEKGLLDLREWDFGKDGILELNGEWKFYWRHFLYEERKYLKESPNDYDFFRVPGSWNHCRLEQKLLPSNSFASYQLRIILPPHRPDLGLKILSLGTAYELYVNGKFVKASGKIARDKESMRPFTLPQLSFFEANKDTLDLVLQISNFHHKDGGFWNSISLGEKDRIQRHRDRLMAVDLLIVGSLLILAFYHFSIYLLRRQDKSALFFSVVGTLMAYHTLITDEKYLLHLFPQLAWNFTIRTEYISIYLGFIFYLEFIHQIYPKEFSSRILKIGRIFGYILSTFAVFAPPYWFLTLHTYAEGLMLLMGFYLLYVLLLAIYRSREAAKILILGFIVFLTAVINEFLVRSEWVEGQSFLAYGLLVFVLSQSFMLSVRYARAYSKVEDLTDTLEKRVQKRTAEISRKNLVLERKKDEIARQNEIIEKKSANTMASISYASRIQKAILGKEEGITSNFRDSFIFLQPRDIVSGDFYWYTEVKRSITTSKETGEKQTIFYKVIVAADCTGHGIPAGFMTVMGNALLDEIINENKVTNPSRVLSVLNRKLLMKLQPHGVNDGMDMAILVFDDFNKTVQFAGAHNPLYHVRDGVIHKIDGSKFPIGSTQYKVKKKYENHVIPFQEGDVFYIFSDGFQDQFGGEAGKKYYKKRFREFLLSISNLPLEEQKQELVQELNEWMKEESQTDDILVIGIKT